MRRRKKYKATQRDKSGLLFVETQHVLE